MGHGDLRHGRSGLQGVEGQHQAQALAPHAEAQAGLPDEQARQGTFGGADLAGPVAQAAGIGGAFLEGVADSHEAAVLGQGQARTSPAQHGQLIEQHAGGLWRNNGVGTLAGAAAGAGVLLLVVLALSTWVARRLGFSTEDEITSVFCGSKKTLASDVPMATQLFGANPAIGLIMLPIMFYHQIRLFVCALLANRYARRVTVSQPGEPVAHPKT